MLLLFPPPGALAPDTFPLIAANNELALAVPLSENCRFGVCVPLVDAILELFA